MRLNLYGILINTCSALRSAYREIIAPWAETNLCSTLKKQLQVGMLQTSRSTIIIIVLGVS